MRNGNQMLTGTIKQACARVCAAAALICGLLCSSAFVAGAPQMAFADMDAGATPRVQEEEQAPVLVGDARLTRLSDASVLVELMNADEQTTVSVGLEALNAAGASLGGSTFTFTSETRGLPTAHAVPNGDGLTIVVSNGVHAISSSGSAFALGTLALPEGATRVAVTSLVRVGVDGVERSLEGTGPNLGELALTQDPEPDPKPGDGNIDESGNIQNTSNTQNKDNTTNKDNASNTQEPGGGGDNGGNDDGNNGGPNGGGQGGGGKDMPQTGDGQVIDASAFLLLAGGAALIAAVILILRRRSQKSQRDGGM